MKIAVMGAMPEEIEPILERMDSYETIEYAKISTMRENIEI